MIPVNEIREHVREYGVPETTIERDYVQNWFLNELYLNTDNMIFKGGTAVRKAYIKDYRFSDDLDFTLIRRMNRDVLFVLIEKTRGNTKKKVGIDFENEFDLREVANGWKVLLHYRSSLTRSMTINIKLDITKSHLESVFLPVEERFMIHNFSDTCNTRLLTYSLNEIMAEKMRTLFERGWPRDLYDVYRLWDITDLEVTISLFEKKCKYKGIEPDIKELNKDRGHIEGSWNSSLSHQMKDVPDFDDVFDTVLTNFGSVDIG